MNLNSIPVVKKFRARTRERVNYSELARELGVSPSHVRRVALGLSTSERVLKRLIREWRRIERDAERAA